MGRKLSCRILGCRWRFGVEESAVTWTCARGCGRSGRHEYGDPERARRVAWHLVNHPPGPPAAMLTAMAGTVPTEAAERAADRSSRPGPDEDADEGTPVGRRFQRPNRG